jgi:hypothetical protein
MEHWSWTSAPMTSALQELSWTSARCAPMTSALQELLCTPLDQARVQLSHMVQSWCNTLQQAWCCSSRCSRRGVAAGVPAGVVLQQVLQQVWCCSRCGVSAGVAAGVVLQQVLQQTCCCSRRCSGRLSGVAVGVAAWCLAMACPRSGGHVTSMAPHRHTRAGRTGCSPLLNEVAGVQSTLPWQTLSPVDNV